MNLSEQQSSELLDRISSGSKSATQQLLAGHRDRLRQMIDVRLDRRLTARFDASDIVQDVLTEASKRLPQYVDERPLPFYAWLRRLAWDRLIKLRQEHVVTEKRAVDRETNLSMDLSDASVARLAEQFVAKTSTPSQIAVRREQHDHVRQTLMLLSDMDREIIVMKYLEQLSLREIATTLEISISATKSRHLRALERLSTLLNANRGELP